MVRSTLALPVAIALAALAFTRGPLSAQSAQAPAAATAAKPSTAPGNVEHGRYIVERVVMCAQCHSTHDASGEIVPETRLRGGPLPVRPPWPNDWPTRTPRIAGLAGYTDDQAIRLFTQGAIARDGRQLKPPMPRFHMTPQDAADVIAYLRSVQ
jgi:mono/diheme cytochrome c family protein